MPRIIEKANETECEEEVVVPFLFLEGGCGRENALALPPFEKSTEEQEATFDYPRVGRERRR